MLLLLNKGSSASPYSPEAEALFARMTSQPSTLFKQAYDDFLTTEGISDILAKLDALYILCAHDAQAARLNIIADQYNLTEEGTLTFSEGEGYASDGTTGYLDSGATANALTHVQQNDATYFAWMRTANNNDNADVIGSTGSNDEIRVSINQTQRFTRANSGSTLAENHAGASEQTGLIAGIRTGASAVHLNYNGVDEGSGTQASSGLPAESITICSNPSGSRFTSAQLSFAGFGASLTEAEMTALYNAFSTFQSMVQPRSFLVVMSGQSNMARYDRDDASSGSGDGTSQSRVLTTVMEPLVTSLLEEYFGNTGLNTVKYYCNNETAFGGSAVLKDFRTENYWYNDSTETYENRYDDWLDELSGEDPDDYDGVMIAWAQGEAEVSGSDALYEEWEAATEGLFALFRNKLGATCPIIIQPLAGNSTEDATMEIFRATQENFETDVSNCVIGPETWDAQRINNSDWHMVSKAVSDEGYVLTGKRLARAIAYTLIVEAGGNPTDLVWKGPVLSSASQVDSTTIDVTIEYPTNCGGTDFTPESGIVGFEVTDSGGSKTVSSAVRQDATTIRLVVDSSLAAGSVTVEYSPTAGALDRTKMVRDNFETPFAMEWGSVQFTAS